MRDFDAARARTYRLRPTGRRVVQDVVCGTAQRHRNEGICSLGSARSDDRLFRHPGGSCVVSISYHNDDFVSRDGMGNKSMP